jgi:hypothetical protein
MKLNPKILSLLIEYWNPNMIEVGDYIHPLPNARGPYGIVIEKEDVVTVILDRPSYTRKYTLDDTYYPVTKKAMLGL